MEYMARGFVVMLVISMPCVLVAAGVGLVVGILQAVTQVQEQTIAAAPKILAVFLVIIIGGFGFTSMLTNLFTEGMSMAFNVVTKNDDYVLPADYYKYTRPFAGEMKDKDTGADDLKQKLKDTENASFLDKTRNMKYIRSPKNTGVKPNFVETKKLSGY